MFVPGGASLAQAGAILESMSILDSIDPQVTPLSLLYRAFAKMSQWDYPSALPLLKSFIQVPSISDYHRLVGKVNHAAALVFCNQFDEATLSIDEILNQATRKKFSVLKGNTLGILAQVHYTNGELKLCESTLDDAKKHLQKGSTIESLIIEKWQALVRLRKTCKRNLLLPLRKMAHSLSHWETLRDCDFHEAILLKDNGLLKKVYFGTPYLGFRSRIIRHFGSIFKNEGTYEWQISTPLNRGDTVPLTLSPEEVLVSSGGQLVYRLFGRLLSDFYKPHRIAAIFADLFPDRFFNPMKSPVLIHQAIKRLRNELKTQKAPIIIQHTSGAYTVEGLKPIKLLIPGVLTVSSELNSEKIRLRAMIGRLNRQGMRHFTRQQAETLLGIPSRTMRYLLSKASKQGLLLQFGKGKNRKYCLAMADRGTI